ncbi:MAG: hypothetical protein MMC23_002956 [Stictis urceolatum]|nr:hypothetical protein [Stictis urceolata]
MIDLKDKVAILTGSSSGIGLATAKLFLSLGAKVFGVDMSKPTDEEIAKAADDPSSSFSFHQADLTQPTAAEEVVKACVIRFGERIDVLANIAGIMDGCASADKVSDSQLGRVIDVNLKAPIKLMGAVLPRMKSQQSGSIINVASVAGYSGAAAGIAYTASKHGLVGATKNVAWRFRDEGIRCNAIAPGGVMTNIQSSVQDFDMDAYTTIKPYHDLFASESRPPMEAMEIANTIAFLASSLATPISGVLLPIDKALAAA